MPCGPGHVSVEDQPDLRAIPSFYQTGTGEFLVTEMGGQVIGTIDMKDLGVGQVALRKMFVAPAYRGREHGVAQALLRNLMDIARARNVRKIFLGTTDKFVAAHRFYEKNGFQSMEPEDLPNGFPRMDVDTRFYGLKLA